MHYTLEQIIELAQNIELEDQIDWSNTKLDPSKIYQVIGSQVYEMYQTFGDSEEKEVVLLATVVKLVVENFVLNVKNESNY